MRFEWDEDKASANVRKHGVAFEQAIKVFEDPDAIEIVDDEHSADEVRFATIGSVGPALLYVVFTSRGDAVRIIHARGADRRMKRLYEKERR